MVTQLQSTADMAQWNKITISIFKQDVVVNVKTIKIDLLEDFGTVKLGDIKAHALTYYITQTRKAQNAYLMYKVLINFLIESAYKHLMSDLHKAISEKV